MSDRMRILALEPYYGGSHQAVLDGLVRHVDADWTVLTLPARKWKWRMRGSAITMASEAREIGKDVPFDLVFASTFLNLAEWKALAGPELATVPSIVYFHENQLLYPNRHTAEWDLQFPLTNITSALAADRCLFNSRYNLEGFLDEIPAFIRGFPDHRPRGIADRIREKSEVLAPPFETDVFEDLEPERGPLPRIVWPHRWEHDKNPTEFFAAVGELADEGLDFEVAVAGQSFRETEELVCESASRLGHRLVHCEQPADRVEYILLLSRCDIAVSTAVNEFFGIAMMEACHAGCLPIVPDRLAYPELYPDACRYRDIDELVSMLRAAILDRPEPGAARGLSVAYTFDALAARYEEAFQL